jgi:hypothetical protein
MTESGRTPQRAFSRQPGVARPDFRTSCVRRHTGGTCRTCWPAPSPRAPPHKFRSEATSDAPLMGTWRKTWRRVRGALLAVWSVRLWTSCACGERRRSTCRREEMEMKPSAPSKHRKSVARLHRVSQDGHFATYLPVPLHMRHIPLDLQHFFFIRKL